MESSLHRFRDLFAQLGLATSAEDIAAFIASHAPLPGNLALADAPFWTAAQSRMLQEMTQADADWSELVDALDAALRRAG